MERLGKILKILVKRWTSDSPKLFASITNIAVIIGTIASIILLLPVTLPAWLVTALGILIAILSGFGVSSKLTTNSRKIINETNNLI